jgi:hypothetical protein
MDTDIVAAIESGLDSALVFEPVSPRKKRWKPTLPTPSGAAKCGGNRAAVKTTAMLRGGLTMQQLILAIDQ